jgi:hypothetical protein
MSMLRALLIAAGAAAASYIAVELVRLAQERWGVELEVKARATIDDLVRRARFEEEVQRALPHVFWDAYQALEEGAEQ